METGSVQNKIEIGFERERERERESIPMPKKHPEKREIRFLHILSA
jgi:hypothetical protein